MRRRFVWVQGKAAFPLKILFERYDGINDGYYVGGWTEEPVFISPLRDVNNNQIYFYGISATGPGTNDWVAGGWVYRPDEGGVLLFASPSGITEVLLPDIIYNAISMGGNFSNVWSFFAELAWWATADGSTNSASLPGNVTTGFILPDVLEGSRLRLLGGLRNNLRQRGIVPNPDLSYAVIRGDEPSTLEPVLFSSGNPWLATADGSFTRLSTDLNNILLRCSLVGLTLYDTGQDWYGNFFPPTGLNSLTVNPYTIATDGTTTPQNPITINFVAPDPNAYFSWDASLFL